ncbi:MAG: AbiH family protein, partial [Bacteroidota bacterium]
MAQKSYLIIGNGFDLAHGAPTSFIDFSNWLLEDYAKRFFKAAKENESIKFVQSTLLGKFTFDKYLKTDHLHTKNWYHPLYDAIRKDDHSVLINLLNDTPFYFNYFFEEKFILELYSERQENWFAIENKFYEYLTKASTDKDKQ